MGYIIIPLLVAVGYHDVTETHRAGELGKDIVFWDTDKLDNRVNYAVVVKATNITGSARRTSASAGNVQTQIRQCFNAPYRDPRSGEERRVHQCWVMTSKKLGTHAVEAITASLDGNQPRDVTFIDGTMLWRLVEKYLPVQAVWQKAREVFETLDSLDSHYQVVVRPADAGPGLDAYIEEKYSGAATDKPFSVGATLTFPSTTEGQEAQEAFERHLGTGSAVKLPGEFVAATEVPELLRQLTGGEFNITRLSIQPAPAAKPIPVRIALENEAGSTLPSTTWSSG